MTALQAALLDRDSRRQGAFMNTGTPRDFTAFKLVNGVGEFVFDVPFPWQYTERPCFTFGGELDDNEKLEAGSFPEVSAVVHRWTTRGGNGIGVPDPNHRRYLGCRVAVRIRGHVNQRTHVHLRFHGIAIVSPMNDTESPDDPI